MPKISVLMPVYKTPEKYLREAIESILAQTFTDFEFLILDDCPEDDREAVVKSYDDKRIKYRKNECNLGIALSRNKLIDWAKGEYLAIFDHDDMSMPERLEKEAAYLDDNPDVGIVSSQAMFFGRRRKIAHNPNEDKDIKLALMRGCAVVHPAAMVRRCVLTENHICYEAEYSPAEDYALWGRLAACAKFYNLSDFLLKYRVHKDNTSRLKREEMENASARVQAFVSVDYPRLYEEFIRKSLLMKEVRLFGVVPILKITTGRKFMRICLFGVIPLFSVRFSRKLSRRSL